MINSNRSSFGDFIGRLKNVTRQNQFWSKQYSNHQKATIFWLSSFASVSRRLWSRNPCGCPQAQGTFGNAIPGCSNRQTVLPIRSVERDSSYPDRTSLNKSCLQSAG